MYGITNNILTGSNLKNKYTSNKKRKVEIVSEINDTFSKKNKPLKREEESVYLDFSNLDEEEDR
jgi:hypothetical protein